MASSAPGVNRDLSADAQSTPVRCLVTPEETIEQMKLLIKENTDLKETLQQEKLQQEKQQQEKLQQEKQQQEKQLQEKLQQALQSQRVEELQRNLAQLQEAYTQLTNKNCRLEEEVKRGEIFKTRLEAAEQALADKQMMDRTKPWFPKQGEMYLMETYGEREAREKEDERLCVELEGLKEENRRLQKAFALASQPVTAIQGCHWPLQGAGPEGGAAAHSRGPEISKEAVNALTAKLEAAEKALADKQAEIYGMKQKIFWMEKELKTIPVVQMNGEVCFPETYGEREARVKEKERMCVELEALKGENRCLQEELDALARCGEHPRAHLSQM